jgi:pimeloyl-ACP methyl ester carboxylesterase
MLLPVIALTRTRILPAFLAALWLAAPHLAFSDDAPQADSSSIVGVWQGSLKVGGIELRLLLRFAKDGENGFKASLDSPDQGAKGIPADAVSFDKGAVKVEIKKIKGVYEGTLSTDGTNIKGTWKQTGPALPLDLKRLDKEPDFSRPQEPKKPYPYLEEEVTYENSAAKIKLAGTLTLPKTDLPVAAVLLITGSGAQDRDESLLGHKPFLVLADYLTRRGIAVLRVDDRGVGGSTGDVSRSTTDDFAGDVLAGVAYLKGRKEINSRQIGLAGHSEGGLIAPLAASRSDDVAFVVMLAGTGVSGEEILYLQGAQIAKAQGASALALAVTRASQERMYKVIREEPDLAKMEAQLRKVVAEQIAVAVAASPDSKAALEAQAEAQVKAVLSPWYRFFLTYDPVPALRKVRCPVLAINGEKDLQVDPKQNLPAIEKALQDGGNADSTIKELPGLNHLFQHCQTGAPSEYGKIDETFSPEALEIVGNWIVARTTKPGG